MSSDDTEGIEQVPDDGKNTTSLSELNPWEKRTLLEFRKRLEEAILGNQLLRPCRDEIPIEETSRGKTRVNLNDKEDLRDISLWGVPLLPSKGHECTDVILLKFLRATEFMVSDALEMLRRTLRWRRQHGINGILEEELGSPELKNTTYMKGTDKEGHPLCYNIFGVFKDKDLYYKTFGNKEKSDKFLRWRIQFMERRIKQLGFKPGEVGSMIQITDLKDSLDPTMKELRGTTKKLILLLQDNYPEFVAKNIFVNVSFRYYAYHALFYNSITQRTKNNLIFARPSKVTETLLKYIAPENIPIRFGGFKREGDDEFSTENGGVSEFVIRGGGTEAIEIPIIQPGVTVLWDITVVGWEVNYKEEFIPDDECSYRVLIKKDKRLEESVRNSYYISEPGRVVLTIDNRSLKKKRVLFRSKTKPTVPLYTLLR